MLCIHSSKLSVEQAGTTNCWKIQVSLDFDEISLRANTVVNEYQALISIAQVMVCIQNRWNHQSYRLPC